MRPWILLLVLSCCAAFATASAAEGTACVQDPVPCVADEVLCPDRFTSQLGSLVPESVLPSNSSLDLVRVASRLVGRDAWPVTDKLVDSLSVVSRKLSDALQADCTTELFPSPLAFTSVRGLDLKEAKHLADAPCARPCTKRVYPAKEDFAQCKQCSSEHVSYKRSDLAGIEVLITLNYTRKSHLLGATQTSLIDTYVKLLKAEGTEVKMIGSTYRLAPSAAKIVKYFPLDALASRYVAWEVRVEFSGPNVLPFCIEKENLILHAASWIVCHVVTARSVQGLWQTQQPGQDFRMKEVTMTSDSSVVIKFVTAHIPPHDGELLVKMWQRRVSWLSKELQKQGVPDTKIRVLKAFEVYDETLADQLYILAGRPRGSVPLYQSPPKLLSIAICLLGLGTFVWHKKHSQSLPPVQPPGSISFPTMAQFTSDHSNGRLSLSGVPLRAGGIIDVVDIEICRRPDGSDWLLGAGSSGQVFKGVKNGVQPVAVKVLRHNDEIQLAQFAKEIALLRRLSFDGNIIQFYGACLQQQNTMMVLEYMAGGDLMAAIANDAQNKLRWSRKGHTLALGIARGLVHLHANKVIHMDLKSQNVLLNREQTVAKVADVGLSRGLQSSTSTLSLGTLEYAAPEVLLGRYCNEKADIFSFGIILWELVTHCQPDRGGLRNCKVPQECPECIDQLINSCLDEDSEKRPSAKHICDTIRLWQLSMHKELKAT